MMIVVKSKHDILFEVTGNWANQASQLKKQFPQLTDADLRWEVGKKRDLLKRLAARLNKRRKEVIKLIRASEPPKTLIS